MQHEIFPQSWWDLITCESILVLESLIVSLCLKYLVNSSKWRVELGVWEVVFFPVRDEIEYSFLLNFGIVQIWVCTTVWITGFWFTIIFSPLKDSLTLYTYVFFFFCYIQKHIQNRVKYIYLHLFCPIWSIENKVTKVTSKYFNGNFDHFICLG